MFHFSLSLIFHTPTDNFPLGGICHALRCPCYFYFVLRSNILAYPATCKWANSEKIYFNFFPTLLWRSFKISSGLSKV
jgi:hypothetical protein